MFANLSRQRIIFIIAILALALTAGISLANSALRSVSNTLFNGRTPQAGGASGTPGQPPNGFVPPSDFQTRNLDQQSSGSNRSTQTYQNTRGNRIPRMGALGGFAGRSGGLNMFGSLFGLGINPPAMIWVGLGFSVLFLAALLFSANAALHARAWGLNLATVLALLSLVTSIPSLMALPNLLQRGYKLAFMLNPALSVINVIAALMMLILAILPSFRDEFAPVQEVE